MSPPAEVHAVSNPWQKSKCSYGDNRYNGRTPQSQKTQQKQMPKTSCRNCGYEHKSDVCPAKGKRCNVCKIWNHLPKFVIQNLVMYM